MKKFLSIVLVGILMLSPVSITTKANEISSQSNMLSEDIVAMNKLGLLISDQQEFAQSYPTRMDIAMILLKIQGLEATAKSFMETENFLDSDAVKQKEYKNALAFIKANPKKCLIVDNEKNFRPNEVVNEHQTYKLILQLLGYKKDVDFKDENVMSFAKSVGLHPAEKSLFTNDDLAKVLNDCLKSKTKMGREYFEVLLESGFMSDYNKNKKVPEPLVFDGKTQPIFNHNDAIYEKVYVESPEDTDIDGKRDLIEVWIKRPVETEKGMKVPAIFEMSPYRCGTNDDLYITHNVDKNLTVSKKSNKTYEDIKYVPQKKTIPESRKSLGKADNGKVKPFEFGDWYNYFLPRGYAVVFSGGIGTLGSEGITSCGSVDETISTVAIIDWLNGRTKAFTNKTDNIEVSAEWCTGSVGMSGTSYEGTLAIAAATTGVEGLKTIVPVAGISNWYDYYRANGVCCAAEGWQGDDADLLATYCMSRMLDPKDYSKVKSLFDKNIDKMIRDEDRVTGDYNTFWDERNYLNNADKIKASVFIVHGLKDWNVKTKQFDGLWKKLEEYKIPHKIILHQGDHMNIDNLAGIDYNDIMNRWFDYWLYDIKNNVMEDVPTATIQNNTNLKWEKFNSWPLKGNNTKFYLNHDTTFGKLTLRSAQKKLKETFTDDLVSYKFNRKKPELLKWRDTMVKEPHKKRPDRLAYISEPLKNDIRISGTVNISIKASINQPTANISAMLVDYGSEYRPTLEQKVVVPNGIIFGQNAGSKDIVNFVMDKKKTDYQVISRGWMDAQNYVANYRVDPIKPKKEYTFKLDMQPMDYVVKKGHKIGLIILSTDAEYTTRPFKTTKFILNTSESFIEIPVINELKK